MSYITFVSQKKPEDKLIRELTYEYHPDVYLLKEITEAVEKEMKRALGTPNYLLHIDIKISVKEYAD